VRPRRRPVSARKRVDGGDRRGHRRPARQICLDYDTTRQHNSGSTIPIKVRLCDMAGGNISSPSIALTAIGVRLTPGGALMPAQDAGNSNPGGVFRYQSAGYMFNLKTTGLATGLYELQIAVSGDPTVYGVAFRIR
jgi:hypothetical protein